MVKYNQQIGKIKGVTIIELGNGDTKVAYVHCKEDKYTGIQFTNDTPKKIGGSDINTTGVTTDELQPNAMITFTRLESIEIVEKALRKAKIKLKTMQKITNQKPER